MESLNQLLFARSVNCVRVSQRPFDGFPFIFLNLILSCLAAIQAPVIMMSQNRSSKKDRCWRRLRAAATAEPGS